MPAIADRAVPPVTTARIESAMNCAGSAARIARGGSVLRLVSSIIQRPCGIAPPEATVAATRAILKGEAVSVAGKTGTAQLDEGMPHSWFAGFAPYEGDRAKSIAFAVVVEHGGYGAQTAAPVAREIIESAVALGIIDKR